MLNLHFTALHFFIGKSVILKRWNIVIGKRSKAPIVEYRYKTEKILERSFIHFRCSFQQHKSTNCNRRHSFLQGNESRNILYRKRKFQMQPPRLSISVKFDSDWLTTFKSFWCYNLIGCRELITFMFFERVFGNVSKEGKISGSVLVQVIGFCD